MEVTDCPQCGADKKSVEVSKYGQTDNYEFATCGSCGHAWDPAKPDAGVVK